jgi:16S rRNA (cytosine967-C5)-methyltransferase
MSDKPSGKKSVRVRAEARDIALGILYQIEVYKRQANIILDKSFQRSGLSDRDRRLVHELVYGVLRWKLKLDWMIDKISHIPTSQMTPWIRNILRLAMYQLSFTDRIPARAAVNEAVTQAGNFGHRGTKALVNAILREYLRTAEKITYPDFCQEPLRHIVVLYSHPEWLVQRWIDRFGVYTAREICDYNNKIPFLNIRVNTLLISRDALRELLEAEGVPVSVGNFAPECLKITSRIMISQRSFFQAGLCQVQDEASILISHLLSPRKGERILDACAGPGGKVTHIAELMGDKGEIIAIDKNPHRLTLLRENCQRLGITSIKPVLEDARNLTNSWGEFDRILIDAPCSSLGVIRHHPEIKWLREEEHLDRYHYYQLAILEGVKPLLKRGGILVYCVCSFEPEETVKVIRHFLAQNPYFIVDRMDSFFPPLDTEGYFWSLPYLSDGMDGVFAVRLRNNGRD